MYHCKYKDTDYKSSEVLHYIKTERWKYRTSRRHVGHGEVLRSYFIPEVRGQGNKYEKGVLTP